MVMRVNSLNDLPGHMKRRIEEMSPVPKAKGKRRGEPNKLELAFKNEWLKSRLMISGPFYEAITLNSYDGSEDERASRYTGDWAWWEWEVQSAGFSIPRLSIAEVKGSRKAKNARESIAKLKSCAARFPEINFFIAERKNGLWRVGLL